MAKPKSKKSTRAGGSKKVQKKLIEGAGKISEKVAAKATAGKGKPARKTVKQDIAAIAEQEVAAEALESGAQTAQQAPGDVDKIADLVASRLGQTNNLAQEAMGSVDKIADLVAARLGQTSDLVQKTLAKQVDKIVDLVASRLDQTSNLTQQTLEKQVDKIAALVNTHTNTERSKVMSTLNLTGELKSQEGLDKLVEMVAAKLSQSAGGAAEQKAQPSPAADKKASKLSTVPLNWEEVYYTNCPMVSASNIDQELGWAREEFKKIGVKYALLALPCRERLVPALHPQPRQPDPIRRYVPAHRCSGGHSPDEADWVDVGA